MSYAIALIHAWLLEHPEHYCSWVNPYTQLRWCPNERKMLAVRVGGHWRRLADYATLLPALRCVCKFEVLAKPVHLGTPMRCGKRRWDERGEMIPPKLRVWVWL